MSNRKPPPPPPKPPKKSSPYAGEEEPTQKRNATLRMYGAWVAAFDHLSEKRRVDLTELGCLFSDAPSEIQDRMLSVCRWLAEGHGR